jgi:hypothetical protein
MVLYDDGAGGRAADDAGAADDDDEYSEFEYDDDSALLRRVYDVVVGLWPELPGRFKDYVGPRAKKSGYQVRCAAGPARQRVAARRRSVCRVACQLRNVVRPRNDDERTRETPESSCAHHTRSVWVGAYLSAWRESVGYETGRL